MDVADYMSAAIDIVSRRIPLSHSYFGLSNRQKVIWNYFYRWLIPPRERWFFEGNRSMWGQLWFADRKALYQTVRGVKPQVVFEVGTWKGGGSTYFIAQALCDNGSGILHTVELNPDLYETAIRNFEQHAPKLMPYVRFHLGSSTDVYPEILKSSGIDLLFLDGIGAEQSLVEFRMFEPHFKAGSLLIAHDWNDEKMSVLRPHIESLHDWQPQSILRPPESVGMAVFVFRPEQSN